VEVITPATPPNISVDSDWSFPDTEEGIMRAIKAGTIRKGRKGNEEKERKGKERKERKGRKGKGKRKE
jgi:hypothetical protein